jgi:hypothetical protein
MTIDPDVLAMLVEIRDELRTLRAEVASLKQAARPSVVSYVPSETMLEIQRMLAENRAILDELPDLTPP